MAGSISKLLVTRMVIFAVLVGLVFVIPYVTKSLELNSYSRTKDKDRKKESAKYEHNVCRLHGKARFYGQGYEDKGIFEHYFKDPLYCNGSFVEIGALDGKTYTNTKFFEDHLGWNGVLIEADPNNFLNLVKNRPSPRVTKIGMAVCPRGQNITEFVGGANIAIGGVLETMSKHHLQSHFRKTQKRFKVPCMPIGDMLRNAGVRAVDFFVIDVEGGELAVLNTMDWSIPVKVFVIEGFDAQVKQLMTSNGYDLVTNWNIRKYCVKDCPGNAVYVSKRLLIS